jgi:predicted Zn-dependent protease
MAVNWRTKVPTQKPRVGRKAFLNQIDGLVYGKDPRKGYREDNWYYLPQYKVKIPIPQDWKFAREGSDFQMTDPEQKVASLLAIYPDAKADEVATAFLEASGAKLQQNELTTQEGMNVRRLLSVLQDGKQTAVIVSSFFQLGADVFGFHGIAEKDDYQTFAKQIKAPASGFSLVKDRTKLNPKPKRILVKSADRSGTVKQTLKRFKVKEDLWNKVAWLNGKRLTDVVAAGEQIKVIK